MSALGEAAVEFVVSGSTSTGVMMSMFGVGGLDGAIKVLTCRGRGAAALSEELRGGDILPDSAGTSLEGT